MNDSYRLSVTDLYRTLEVWDRSLSSPVFVAACGGTALTLYGHKASTKDIDFLVPDPIQFAHLIDTLEVLGYIQTTGHGYRHPNQPWVFDLFEGQTVFQTELIDPVQDPRHHREIKRYTRLVLACLTPDDLVISKMFRGDLIDREDSVLLIRQENIDLVALCKRYIETAGYYYNPASCKTNLGFLISDLKGLKFDTDSMTELYDEWIP